MAKAAPIINAFNSGELSPLLDGRTDLSKYTSACKILENFIPQVEGPAVKRTGTRFVRAVKTAADTTRLIPFEFSTTQAYILELGDLYFRVYKDNGTVNSKTNSFLGTEMTVANPGVITFTTTTNTVAEHYWPVAASANHGPFRLTTTGSAPTDLATGTDYWIKPLTSTTCNLSLTDGGALIEFNTPIGGSGTHTLTPFDNSTDHVPQVEVVTAYDDADVDAIQFTQSADVLYLAHKDYPPKKISRLDHDQWTIEDIVFDWVPFEDENVNRAHSMYCREAAPALETEAGQTVRNTGADRVDFVSNDVGRHLKLRGDDGHYEIWKALKDGIATGDYVVHEGNIYINDAGVTVSEFTPPIHIAVGQVIKDGKDGISWEFRHHNVGYCLVTSLVDADNVETTVVYELPSSICNASADTNATIDWAWGAWDSLVNGYPRAVTFFDDRLWWAGSIGGPQTLWGSRVGDYENHRISDEDESAVIFTVNTDRVNVIEWLSPGRVMAMGTAGGEFVVSGETADEAITPTSIRVVRHSTYGSRETVAPVRVENVVLFVQRAGKKLREFVFDFDSDSYRAPDLTILSDHIAEGLIKTMAFQQEPSRTLWCVLDDGALIALTYERFQTVVGWHRHVLGGTDVLVKSAAVIPSLTGDADEVWLVVERTINSVTTRHVEYITAERADSDALADAIFMDDSRVWTGSSTTVDGLDHLEGETVQVLAVSGGTAQLYPDATVSSGAITLSDTVTKAQVGLGYTATVQTMRLEAGGSDGTAQAKTKRFTNAVLRVHQTGGGLFYGKEDDITTMDEVQFADDMVLLDGDTDALPWPGGYETDGHLTIKHNKPLPCTITAIMPHVVTQDDR